MSHFFKLTAAAMGTALFALGLTACGGEQAATEQSTASENATPAALVVYTSRKEHLVQPLFERFTAETGIPIDYITDSAGPLLTRLAAEGENSQADILMTVDAGNLWQATEQDLLQPLDSAVLAENVPANLQDPQQRWYSLTIRARTLVYSTERVDPATLDSYEALAEPAWQGRLCLRTSKKVYNQSLVATIIAAQGEQQAEQIVRGWIANLALPPFSNDTKVMEAIIAGQCDVGIVNSYYFARLQQQDPQIPLALFWANQQDRGVHINVSGAGVTRASKQPQQAQRLLEWLSTPASQQMLMELNGEYPVNKAVALTSQLADWGSFKADPINVSKAGELQAQAVMLMDRAGYQ